jgi:hypothetical protein
VSAADTFAPWPPSQTERDLRAERDSAEAKIAAVVLLILDAEAKDGRVTACSLRAACGMGKRVRG